MINLFEKDIDWNKYQFRGYPEIEICSHNVNEGFVNVHFYGHYNEDEFHTSTYTDATGKYIDDDDEEDDHDIILRPGY